MDLSNALRQAHLLKALSPSQYYLRRGHTSANTITIRKNTFSHVQAQKKIHKNKCQKYINLLYETCHSAVQPPGKNVNGFTTTALPINEGTPMFCWQYTANIPRQARWTGIRCSHCLLYQTHHHLPTRHRARTSTWWHFAFSVICICSV